VVALVKVLPDKAALGSAAPFPSPELRSAGRGGQGGDCPMGMACPQPWQSPPAALTPGTNGHARAQSTLLAGDPPARGARGVEGLEPSVAGGRFSASNYAQLRSANGAGFGPSNEGAGSVPNNILLTSLLRSNSPCKRRRGLAGMLLSTKTSKKALASPPASPGSIIRRRR